MHDHAVGGTAISVGNRVCSASATGTTDVPETVGYVRVGSFGGAGAAATSFADGIQNAIAAVEWLQAGI